MATKKATPAAKAAPAKKPCAKKACCAKTVKDVKPAAIKEMKASQVHQILGKYILCDGYDMVVDTEKSHGSYMYDAKHNKEYLDFFSFFASMPIGFNHPKLHNEDFIKEIGEVALHKISNSDFYTTTMAEFVEAMATTAKPDYMKKMFFVDGGGLAVENALKTAFDWKFRKNLEKGVRIDENEMKIIHFKQAFHGRTGYTLSLTNTSDPRKYMYFPKFDWPRITNPKAIFPLEGENLKKTIESEKIACKEIQDACEKYGSQIAGLIIEPVQGEGGDNHFRKEFIQELRKFADKYDFLLIFDEVQAGGGLSGKWWTHEHYGVKPDIICFGKKFQVCGILANDRVLSVKNNVFVESSRLNSTWGGNIVDMKRTARYLKIIKEEKLVENAAKMGKILLEGLEALSKKTKGKIFNVRGKGLLCAFDMKDGDARNKFIDDCMNKENMIVLACGDNSIRFRPFLDITEADVKEGLARMERVLTAKK